MTRGPPTPIVFTWKVNGVGEWMVAQIVIPSPLSCTWRRFMWRGVLTVNISPCQQHFKFSFKFCALRSHGNFSTAAHLVHEGHDLIRGEAVLQA